MPAARDRLGIYLHLYGVHNLTPATFWFAHLYPMSAQSRTNPRSQDPNTLANVLDFAITTTVLNYDLSFHEKALEGVVQHTLHCTTDVDSDGAVTGELWLDSSLLDVLLRKQAGGNKTDQGGPNLEKLSI